MSLKSLAVIGAFATFPAIGLAQCRFPANAPGRLLTYTFQPDVTPTGTTLHVTLQFQGGPSGTQEIEIPTHWAGETLHALTNLRGLSEQAIISDSSDSDARIVRFPPNRAVTIAYNLVKNWDGPFREPMQFHPVLMPQYLEINGENALVYPKMSSDGAVTVNFEWRNLPSNWVLATSFGDSPKKEGHCQSYSGRWGDVAEALFTAGEFRLYHFQIRNRPAVLAIRDQWTFTDEEAIAAITKTVGVVRDFWHDDNFPYFLITLKAFDTEKGHGDGSAFTNAFWIYMSRQDPISSYLPTLAHEAFHTWNPKRMGRYVEQENSRIDWFKEGFTTYYAYLLLWRAGLITMPEYVESVNHDFRLYAGSTSPYVRGRIVAFWSDAEIRKHSADRSSLDSVMFDMVREGGDPLTQARALETIGRHLSIRSRQELQRAVEQGALPVPAGDALGPCAPMSIDELPTFDLGFDFSASWKAHTVIGVRESGPAFRAGLRDGEKLKHVSVYNDQPDKIAKFSVQTDTGLQTIEYYPRGKEIRTPQYHLDQAAYNSNAQACGRSG